MKGSSESYSVYILECADGTLYAGSTNDVEKRVVAHNTLATGAKYTKTRRPVKAVHIETFATKSEALKREAAIKKLTRAQKLTLIQ